MICKYAEIFCWKNVSSFCSAKATHIFSAKNIRILYMESAKTVNEMTLNELVKPTMLWTTGPWIQILLRDVKWIHFEGRQLWQNCFPPSEKRSTLIGKKFYLVRANCFLLEHTPFQKRLGLHVREQEISLVKTAENLPCISSPLNTNLFINPSGPSCSKHC